jgi:methyltransferase-like protein
MRYPKQLGGIGKTKRGNIMLTNPRGESFNVHETVAFIWDGASGKRTIQEIADMLIEAASVKEEDKEAERENVILALRSLERKGLIEYRQGM